MWIVCAFYPVYSCAIQERDDVERTKWFYSTDQIYEAKLEDTLNDWGERGWELVSLTLIPPPKELDRGPHLFLAVFKVPDASA
jgi:hypothetical protein